MNNMPKQLPVFMGYTVDLRLKEFRKLIPDKYFEIISFNSPKGRQLLNEYEDQNKCKN
jgi:hypothetical protein